MYDEIDRRILSLLQEDASLTVAAVADRVGLSQTPCWRRIQRMEKEGLIRKTVTLVDRNKANCPMAIFVTVRAPRHTLEWVDAFYQLVRSFPEIVEVHRLTGKVDYLLRIIVPDVHGYDILYKSLVSKLEFLEISAAIVMEEIKFTTAVPTRYL